MKIDSPCTCPKCNRPSTVVVLLDDAAYGVKVSDCCLAPLGSTASAAEMAKIEQNLKS